MDNIDKILDLIENPSRYSPEEIDAMLADPEVHELYRILSETSGSLHASAISVDRKAVDEEWQRFLGSVYRGRRFAVWRKYRAAAIGAIIVTSMVAAGMGIGMSVMNNKERAGKVAVADGGVQDTEIIAAEADSVSDGTFVESAAGNTLIEFENETLESILGKITETNGLDVKYISDGNKSVRLYFVWDTTQPVEETIARLDNFERFDISMDGTTIIVK